MNDDWLKNIHDSMADFETDEPLNLWDDLCGQILPPEDDVKKNTGGVKHFNFFKILYPVAAMLALILSLAYFFIDENLPGTTEQLADINMPQEQTGNTRSDLTYATDKSSEESNLYDNMVAKADKNTVSAEILTSEPKMENDVEPDRIISFQEEMQESSGKTSENNIQQPQDSVGIQKKRSEYTPYYHTAGNTHIALNRIAKTGHSNVSIGVFSTSGTGTEINRKAVASAVATGIGPENSKWNDSPLLGILTYNQGKEITDDIRHRLPIRAGISFSYRLNNRIGIESGVTYTNLSSDIFQGSDSHYLKGKQTLHYIGIPLNLKVNIVSWKGFDIYASAGPMLEKCIAGSYKQSYILNETSSGNDCSDIGEKPLQWSVNASAGLQFNITPLVGIYAEPGASYYFDDGSSLKTIYKEKPLNFNLNLGVRLTFGN